MRFRRIAALAALALVVAACSPGPETGGELEGTDWVLRSYAVDGALTIVPDNLYADAEFASRRLRGFAGCNEFEALYRQGGRTLFITQAGVTLMFCDEEAMAFEQAVLASLGASRWYTARRDTLTIYGPEHEELLVYDAAPRNPVRGTWQVTAFASDGAVTSPLPETELEVTFGLTTVGGFAGCNGFSGTYGTNGNALRVSNLATTRAACEQEILDQETAFLEALQGAALIDSRGRSVNLTTLTGQILVSLARPEPEVGASPSPSASPSEEPSESPSESPSEEPTEAPATPAPTVPPTEPPTAAPTAAPPTAAPTARPTGAPSAAPTFPPVEVAECDLATDDGTVVATITYPSAWFTLTEPAELACRYFDPEEISVPSDPATLVTAAMATVDATPYEDAVTAATDPATWRVLRTGELTVDGLAATAVAGTSIAPDSGFPTETSRFAYLIDVGSAGTVTLFTTGETLDEAFEARSAIVTLMTGASVFASAG